MDNFIPALPPINMPSVKDQLKSPNVIDAPIADNEKSFTFEPVEELFNTPLNSSDVLQIDQNYLNMLNKASSVVNKFNYGPTGSNSQRRPSSATNTYDPLNQNSPPDLTTREGTLRYFKNPGFLQKDAKEPVINNPIFSSMRGTNFDRYYNHPKFTELGWHPYADNESYYNANSDTFDDMTRMWGQFGSLAGTGFMSSYRSIGDMFDGDNYIKTPDIQSATEFTDAMRIGNSSKTGVGAFTNNFLLNSAYTVGILGSIAAEELAMFSAAALTSGGTIPFTAARFGANLVKGGKAVVNLFDVGKAMNATRNMMNAVNNVDRARDFYNVVKTGGKFAGNFFAPETMAAIRSLKTTKVGAQNLSNIAKTSNVFGGFYRDARSINMALSESKLESGMVYNEHLNESLALIYKKNGGQELTDKDFAEASSYASKAAFKTLQFNAPLIWLSNKIVLGTALGGFSKSAKRIFNENMSEFGKRVIRTKPVVDKITGKVNKAVFDTEGNVIEGIFEDVGEGALGGLLPSMKAIKGYTAAGTLRAGAHGALRYMAANLTEGGQEIVQDMISNGTRDYFYALQEDPSAGGMDVLENSIVSAIDSQMNAQGFETFMSGFLMGGLVQGPQKLFFQGIPNVINKTVNSEQTAKYKADKQEYIDQLVKTYNKSWNAQADDPSALFDSTKLNFLTQKQVAEEMKQHAFDGNVFGFMDIKDFGKFQQMYTIFSNGTEGFFKDQLKDYQSLTDEELIQAFPDFEKDVKNGKLRERIDNTIKEIDINKDSYEESKDKFPNPFNKNAFKKGTKEYNEEALKQASFEHARYIYMFTQNGFKKAIERSNSIYSDLASEPIISKLAANDLTVLLDPDSLLNEINILTEEIKTFGNTAEEKKLKDTKKTRLEKIIAIRDVMTAPTNKDDEDFRALKTWKLYKPFLEYVQHLADTKKDFIDKDRIMDVLAKIVDYGELKDRAKVYDKAIEYLNNPERFTDIVNRTNNIFTQIFKSNRIDFEKRIKKYIKNQEANTLLNKLTELGVYPNADQAVMFLKTGDSRFLTEFLNEDGYINSSTNPELYLNINLIIRNYEKITTTEVKDEETTEPVESEEDLFDGLDLDNSPISANEKEDPYIKDLLSFLYANRVKTGQILNWETWLAGSYPKIIRNLIAELKKIWVETTDWNTITNADGTIKDKNLAIKTDDGFAEWIQTQQSNPEIRTMLDKANITFDELNLKTFTKNKGAESVVAGSKTKKWRKQGPGINILQTTVISNKNEKTVYYELVDNLGKSLSENIINTAGISGTGTYGTFAEANENYKKVLAIIPNTDNFKFDGITIKYGMLVKNSDGEEFMILGTPQVVEKYNSLWLQPIKEGSTKKDIIKLKSGEFKNDYKVESLKFTNKVSGDRLSKINISEFTNVYPHQNTDENGTKTETKDDAQRRMDLIMTNLTPLEREALQFVITVNPISSEEKYLKIGTTDENRSVKVAPEKYKIGVRISDPDVNKKVNDILTEKNYTLSNDPNGIFAYVRNQKYTVYDINNKLVDISNISMEDAVNAFSFTTVKGQLVINIEDIKNAYSAQQLFLEKIKDILDGENSAVINISDLNNEDGFKDFGFNAKSYIDISNEQNQLDDLWYYTADKNDNILIIDNASVVDANNVKKSTTYRAGKLNGEYLGEDTDEYNTLVRTIKEDIVEQGLEDMSKQLGRYVAVIKTPDEKITLAQLTQNKLSKDEVNLLLKELADQAAKTIKENITFLGKKDDFSKNNIELASSSYNVIFNQEFNSKFYMAGAKQVAITLDVNSYGTIEINFRDNISGSSIEKLTLDREYISEIQENPENFFNLPFNRSKKSMELEATTGINTLNALKIKVSPDMFRVVFPKEYSIDDIVKNTTTTLGTPVTTDYNLSLYASSALIQGFKDRNQVANQVETASIIVSSNIADIPNDVFAKYESEDFINLPSAYKKTLATKIKNKDRLTEREEKLMANGDVSNIVNVLASTLPETPVITFNDKEQNRINLINKKVEIEKAINDRRQILRAQYPSNKDLLLQIDKDDELNKLKGNLKIIEVNIGNANKIVSDNLTGYDVEQIDTFIDWVKNNLPEFVTISDINTLNDNLKFNGMRVGMFSLNMSAIAGGLSNKGIIYTGEKSPFKYHEAFHAAFRMLLTDEEIKHYLSIAEKAVKQKYGSRFEIELSKFKESALSYRMMSRERLLEEFYEEYLADEFDAFKMNKSSSQPLKGFFAKLIAWIKSIFSKYTKNELSSLYSNINSGKYKGGVLQNNMFTRGENLGVTVDAYKLIPIDSYTNDNGVVGYEYLDPDMTRVIVSNITAMILSRMDGINGPTNVRKKNTQIFAETIADFIKLYDPYADYNDTVYDIYGLMKVHSALTKYYDDVVEAVLQNIALFTDQTDIENYDMEAFENDYGLRNTSDWDKDQSMIGGFSSLAIALRRYIATTTFKKGDVFGHEELTPGETLISPVDFNAAYNGLLKAVKNTTDPIKILQKMYFFSQGNEQTAAVVNRIFNDIGVTNEDVVNGVFPQTLKNPTFFVQILKGFTNFRIDYVLIHRNPQTQEVLSYSVANRDNVKNQINGWSQEYDKRFQIMKTNKEALADAVYAINKLKGAVNPLAKRKTVTDTALEKQAIESSKLLFDTLGIKLSVPYLMYSFASNIQTPTILQKTLLESRKEGKNKGLVVTKSNRETLILDNDTLSIMLDLVNTKSNLFLNRDGSGMRSKLERMAAGNSEFDETIGGSVFKDSNGNWVYAHQLPTYHLQRIYDLNNGKVLDDLKVNEFLKTNILLNSPAFLEMSNLEKLSILRLAGGKTSTFTQTDENLLTETGGINLNDMSHTYGESKPKEFISDLINSYTYLYNTKSQENTIITYDDPLTGELTTSALAPILIRVLEASNTGDMISLPVIKSVIKDEDGGNTPTEEVLNLFMEEIRREYDRIKRESNSETQTADLIEDYNAKNGVRTNTGRAYQFTKTDVLLTNLKARSKNKVSFSRDVQMQKLTAKRLLAGTQSIIVRNQTAATIIGVNRAGMSRLTKVTDGENTESFVVTGGGQITVDDKNINNILAGLGDAVTTFKTDTHTHKVAIGLKTFWTDTNNIADFLKGDPRYVYSMVKGDELPEEVELLDQDAEDEINLKSELETIATQEDLSLEEALDKLNYTADDLKEFIKNRLVAEYNEFRTILDEIRAYQQISNNILTGFTDVNGVITPKAQLAMSQLNIKEKDAEFNLMQIFFNDWLNTKAMNQLLLGDTAMSLKDAVDEIKRAKMQNAGGYGAETFVIDPKSGIEHPVKDISLFPFTDPTHKKQFSSKDELGKTTDGIMYVTPKAMRYMLFGFGKLSPAKVELLDKIEKGESISSDDFFGTSRLKGYKELDAVFNSEKLVYGDGTTYLKMSAIMLTKEWTSVKNKNGEWVARENKKELHNLRLKMEAFEKEQWRNKRGTIAIAAPLSSMKMLKKNILTDRDIFNIQNELTESNETLLDAKFMKLQMINPSNKVEIVDPTQMKTLITSEQNDKTEVILNGVSTTLGEIRRLYNNSVSNRIDHKYINKRNLIFNFDIDVAMDELHKSIKENKITTNLYTFLNYAVNGLKASQSSSNLVDFFSNNEIGGQMHPLNSPLTINKFEQLFLSYFSKGVISERIPGHSLTLVPDAGVNVYRKVFSVRKDENGVPMRDKDNQLIPDRSEIIREHIWDKYDEKPTVYDITELENITEGSKEGIIVMDRLRHDVKEYDENGVYTGQNYTEMLMPSHYKEIMDYIQTTGNSIPDVLAKAFAIRIPSQAKHSAMNVKWVDFLPVYYGSIGIFARELLEVSGADFDVDKVYMHIKEWYEENGKFIEYGKAKSEKESYKNYINYVNKNLNKNSIYAEALEKFNAKISLPKDKLLSTVQIEEALTNGFSPDSIDALSMLGLPVLYDDYIAYKEKNGEPYIAPYNNEILDYKFALLGNPHMTESKDGKVPIAYEPADIEPLTALWNEILNEIPELADLVREDDVDVDNLLGKLRSFANNKEGAASIGAAVRPNLYLSLLKEYDIKIESNIIDGNETLPQVRFNGHTFIGFGKYSYKDSEGKSVNITGEYEIKNGIEDKNSYRRQYVISALITAMTDNAKERMAAKLGINKSALSVVATLVALGVPLKTSILMINHPMIRDSYFKAINKEQMFDPGVGKLVIEQISQLMKLFPDAPVYSVTDEMMIESIKNPIHSQLPSSKDIADSKYTEDDAGEVISILTQFLIADRLSSYAGKMASIMDLASGFGKSFTDIYDRDSDIEKLGLDLSDEQFKKLNYDSIYLPVSVERVKRKEAKVSKGKKEKIKTKPIPSVRVEYRTLRVPLDVRTIFGKDNTWQSTNYKVYRELSQSLLPGAFLTKTKMFTNIYDTVLSNLDEGFLLTAERKDKISTDILSFLTIKAYMQNLVRKGDSSIGSLTNDFIYPQGKPFENINNVIDRLRDYYKTIGKENYFLDQFISNDPASSEYNNYGINGVFSNTYARLSDNQKVKLQNSFMELYASVATKIDAKHIIHYIMVKDGLQYGYNSILDAVLPFTLDTYLEGVDEVHQIFKNAKDNTAFEGAFGMSYNKLINEFVINYLQSNSNNFLLQKKSDISEADIRKVSYDINPKNIDYNTTKEDPDTGYIFGDNKDKIGTVGQTSIRELPNAYPITFKLDLNSYYTDAMENEFAVLLDSQVKAINDDTRVKKLFPKALMSSQDKTAIKKYGPKIYSYLKKKLIDSFGYDIDGGITIVGDELIQNKTLGIPIRIQNSVNESRLIIDAYNGVVPVPVSEKSKVKRTVNLNETLSKKIEFNLNNIRKYKFNTIETKVGTLYSSVEIEFPLVLKVQNQKNKYLDDGVSKYYMLVKVYTSNPIEGDEFIGKDNSIVTGNRAEYIEISTKGSNQQWAGGFMFNTDVFERPSYKTVREFVAQKQIEEGGVNSALTLAGVNFDNLNDDLFDNLDFSTSPALQKGNITANEKEVNVNDVNIADVSDDMFDDLDDSNPPSVSTQPSTSVKAENISSKGSEFAKKLTNVGNTVGLTYKGKEYVNSEHAYQTWKSGEFNQAGYDLKGGKVRGGKIGDTFSIMTDILTEKLKQHPELVQGINERGGLAYIEQSTHNVIGDKFWESTGENKFIEALAKAYQNIFTTQPSTSVEEEVPEQFGSEENILVQNATSIPNSILDLLGLNTNTASYPELTSFWNENIEKNPEAKSKLKEQKIITLKDFINVREAGIYTSDEAFLEQIKQCIL